MRKLIIPPNCSAPTDAMLKVSHQVMLKLYALVALLFESVRYLISSRHLENGNLKSPRVL